MTTSMPRSPSDNTVQVAIRVPQAWLDEADRLVRERAEPGATLTRTDVLRAAMGVGLRVQSADAAYVRGKRGDIVERTAWKYDPKRLTLTHERADFYDIDLEEMTDSASTLDWIIQLAKKTWLSSADLGIFVRILDRLLEPQAGMCSDGKNGKIDVKKRLAMFAMLTKGGR